ncbi:MAG: helix-turn-helix domain-containing protein [Beijerinckiaceae bacterium]
MEPASDPAFDQRIARRVRAERQALGLTLEALAERSGVSRAMISKVERGEASPTAVLLARLSNALGVTLSTLFRDGQEAGDVVRAADRQVWRDPATGYSRRNVSPAEAPVDIVDVTLPPGALVTHDNSVPLNLHQLVWVLEGTLAMTVDGETQDLGPGDCMQMRLDRPIGFQNRTRANTRYAVVLARSIR